MNPRTFGLILAWGFGFLPASGPAMTNANNNALSRFPLDRLSSGGLMLLGTNESKVVWPARSYRLATADDSLSAGLDPRVGPNVRLGDDPVLLPAGFRAQAEPHIARHPLRPDTLVATFQEGRYSDGGAVDCGYSVSRDGGLSWSRDLLPAVTTTVGGPYYRCTDPVVAIDLDGNVFINTLGALDARFASSALLLSRSMNGGVSFEPPIEILRSPDSTVLNDKNWMTVNTFSNTPTAGRIVSTYTRFDNNGYPIALTYSDDKGTTWTPWKYITPVPFQSQGSQPVFLPDGKLAVVYWNFAPQEPVDAFIEVVVSPDGGATFNWSNRVARVTPYDAPEARDGTFLPSAVGNRTDQSLYVVYQGLVGTRPRILFTKSPDAGVTWTAPVPISDNTNNTPVFNAAIGVSPDGRQITVAFYDGRLNPTNPDLVDLFMACSTDGGTNWQPNLRLSTVSSDLRLAPLTGSGYMLGDYLGVAPPIGSDVPAVPVYVDTRGATPDPYVVRASPAAQVTFSGWRAARMSLSQVLDPGAGAPGADPDGDHLSNALEYAFGLNPAIKDSPVFGWTFAEGELAAHYQRISGAGDLTFNWMTSTDLLNWLPTPGTNQVATDDPNPQLKNVSTTFPPNSGGRVFYRLDVGLTY